jgi:superfamily I DNA/RNA helicase
MFVPSKYQTGVFNWVKEGKGNALVSATAGSGKTTTLVEALKLVKGEAVVLAFNKKIQMEMESKLRKNNLNASAYTVHSLCFGVLKRSLGRVTVDDKKLNFIVDGLFASDEEAKAYGRFVVKLVQLAKDDGVCLFWQPSEASEWVRLIEHHNLELEENTDIAKALEFAQKAILLNNKDEKTIDFSDMIYLTMLKGLRMPKYDWVLVDECQDLSRLRQAVCKSLQHDKTRYMFVGDRGQAIYGFTGADSNALDQIVSDFDAVELPLSVSYRCSEAVVNHAKAFYPTIESAEGCSKGSVESLTYNTLVEKADTLNLSHTDSILCRTNAPLLRTAFSLIKKGIPCRIEGRDIGQGLINIIQKWKVAKLDTLEQRLEVYKDREIQKAKVKNNGSLASIVEDKVECIKACIDKCKLEGKTHVKDLIELILSMFSNSDDTRTPKNLLTLCSVHKSKGLEWNRVFLLGRKDYMPSKWAKKDWMKVQENNLTYVAITRAKETLVEVEGVDEYLKSGK